MATSDGGLFASARQLLATGVETLRVRLELLSTEVEQEKLRLFDAVLWAGMALLLLGMGLLFLCGLIVVLLWDQHRLLALGGLTVIFLGSGYWVLQIARTRLRAPGGLFASSVAELERDRSELTRERAGLDEAE
ncbi:MAG: phage holin family protein [Hylemonella sp.]|nr:phage holin family protein [Hylemonella sp.]MDP1936777.1 phage holin family protein [Hylemonella sp.]